MQLHAHLIVAGLRLVHLDDVVGARGASDADDRLSPRGRRLTRVAASILLCGAIRQIGAVAHELAKASDAVPINPSDKRVELAHLFANANLVGPVAVLKL